MVRMIDLTSGDTSSIDVVAYRSGDLLVIAVNVGGVTVARVSVPADGNTADVIGKVAAEVAMSWAAAVVRH